MLAVECFASSVFGLAIRVTAAPPFTLCDLAFRQFRKMSASLDQFAIASNFSDSSVLKHNNAVRIHNCAESVCYDNTCGMHGIEAVGHDFLGSIIERARRFVKEDDARFV